MLLHVSHVSLAERSAHWAAGGTRLLHRAARPEGRWSFCSYESKPLERERPGSEASYLISRAPAGAAPPCCENTSCAVPAPGKRSTCSVWDYEKIDRATSTRASLSKSAFSDTLSLSNAPPSSSATLSLSLCMSVSNATNSLSFSPLCVATQRRGRCASAMRGRSNTESAFALGLVASGPLLLLCIIVGKELFVLLPLGDAGRKFFEQNCAMVPLLNASAACDVLCRGTQETRQDRGRHRDTKK